MRIKVGDFRLEKSEKEEIIRWLDSGRISEGPNVKTFEKNWAEFIGVKHCTLVNSGTSALIAGLCALKHLKLIKEKSKVITTPLTYAATSNAIVNSNLEPVYVDVEKETFTIIPESIKQLLETSNEEFSLIIPVHLIGYPAKMDEINRIAKKYGLKVLEDSAQAHGTLYDNKKTGSMSYLSIFSFYIAHNIQAGELGAVMTNDTELKKTIVKIKANGRACDCDKCMRNTKCEREGEFSFDPRFTHEIIGYNFKTTEFSAILAQQQFRKIKEIIKKRQENVKYLNEGLEKFSDRLQLPVYSEKISYLAYPLIIKKDIGRKKLCVELEKEGVETRPLFGCIPTQQPAYAHLRKEYEGKLPNAEYLSKNGFYIGCHQYLTQEDMDFTIKTFAKYLK